MLLLAACLWQAVAVLGLPTGGIIKTLTPGDASFFTGLQSSIAASVVLSNVPMSPGSATLEAPQQPTMLPPSATPLVPAAPPAPAAPASQPASVTPLLITAPVPIPATATPRPHGLVQITLTPGDPSTFAFLHPMPMPIGESINLPRGPLGNGPMTTQEPPGPTAGPLPPISVLLPATLSMASLEPVPAPNIVVTRPDAALGAVNSGIADAISSLLASVAQGMANPDAAPPAPTQAPNQAPPAPANPPPPPAPPQVPNQAPPAPANLPPPPAPAPAPANPPPPPAPAPANPLPPPGPPAPPAPANPVAPPPPPQADNQAPPAPPSPPPVLPTAIPPQAIAPPSNPADPNQPTSNAGGIPKPAALPIALPVTVVQGAAGDQFAVVGSMTLKPGDAPITINNVPVSLSTNAAGSAVVVAGGQILTPGASNAADGGQPLFVPLATQAPAFNGLPGAIIPVSTMSGSPDSMQTPAPANTPMIVQGSSANVVAIGSMTISAAGPGVTVGSVYYTIATGTPPSTLATSLTGAMSISSITLYANPSSSGLVDGAGHTIITLSAASATTSTGTTSSTTITSMTSFGTSTKGIVTASTLPTDIKPSSGATSSYGSALWSQTSTWSLVLASILYILGVQ